MLNVKMHHLSCWARKQRWAFFHPKSWDVFDLFSLQANSWFRPRIVKTHVQEARDAALLAPLPTRNGELRSPFFEQQMFTDNEQCVIGVSSIGVFFCTAREISFLPVYKSVLAYMGAIVSRDGLTLVWMWTRFWPVKWKEHQEVQDSWVKSTFAF